MLAEEDAKIASRLENKSRISKYICEGRCKYTEVYTAREFNAEFFSWNVRNDAERWLKRQLLSHQRSKLLGTKRTIK